MSERRGRGGPGRAGQHSATPDPTRSRTLRLSPGPRTVPALRPDAGHSPALVSTEDPGEKKGSSKWAGGALGTKGVHVGQCLPRFSFSERKTLSGALSQSISLVTRVDSLWFGTRCPLTKPGTAFALQACLGRFRGQIPAAAACSAAGAPRSPSSPSQLPVAQPRDRRRRRGPLHRPASASPG